MGNFPQTRGAAMLLSRSLQAGSSKLVLRSLAGNGRGISTSRVALPSSLVNPEHSDDVDRSVVEDDELGGGGGEVIEDLGAVGRLHSVCLPTVFLPPEMQEAVDTVLSGELSFLTVGWRFRKCISVTSLWSSSPFRFQGMVL